MGMQKIQHPNSLLISIHSPQTADKSKDLDLLEKKSGVLYQIARSCCHVYTRETKTALETHIKEHKAATRREETGKSAIAKHALGQQHSVLWEETSMLDQAKNNTTLLIKEALHICLTNLELIN